nr:hypothetical protein [Saprospiraceae bacterium]
MTKSILFIISLLAVAFLSCEKVEIPEPKVEGILFKLEGKIDGEDLSVGIDNEDNLMRTYSTFDERDSIWEFSGYLGPRQGVSGPSFKMAFRPNFKGRQITLNTGEVFDRENWNLYNHRGIETRRYPVHLSADHNDSIELTRFYLANQSGQQASSHILIVQLNERKSITACADYETITGQKGSFCSEISADQNGAIPVANWVVAEHSGNQIKLAAKMNNSNAGYLFNWDGEYSEESKLIVNREGTYEVKAKDENGRIFSHKKDLLYDDNQDEYSTYGNDLSLSAEWRNEVTAVDRVQTSSFRFKYTDGSGRDWILAPEQGENNSLRILDQQMHRNNPEEEPTRALLIELNCTLQNTENEILEVHNLRGWIAVGVPK